MDHKPFNFEHAKAGAPIGRLDECPVRVVCWDTEPGQDSVSSMDKTEYPVMALRKMIYHGKVIEVVLRYSINGKQQFGSCNSELVMLPLGYIDEIPVYVGDTIMYQPLSRRDGWGTHVIHTYWVPSLQLEYKWPEPEYILDGIPVKEGDILWFDYHQSSIPWCRVKVCGKDLAGVDGHFAITIDHLTENPDRYSWKEPLKHESWQPRIKSGKNTEFIRGESFPSRADCENQYKGDNYFIKAELTHTYWVKP
jgi:hypothetical protein